MIYTHRVKFRTSGDGEIVDLTKHLAKAIDKSGASAGMLTVCTTGSTAGLTTIEFEPGLIKDVPELMQNQLVQLLLMKDQIAL